MAISFTSWTSGTLNGEAFTLDWTSPDTIKDKLWLHLAALWWAAYEKWSIVATSHTRWYYLAQLGVSIDRPILGSPILREHLLELEQHFCYLAGMMWNYLPPFPQSDSRFIMHTDNAGNWDGLAALEVDPGNNDPGWLRYPIPYWNYTRITDHLGVSSLLFMTLGTAQCDIFLADWAYQWYQILNLFRWSGMRVGWIRGEHICTWVEQGGELYLFWRDGDTLEEAVDNANNAMLELAWGVSIFDANLISPHAFTRSSLYGNDPPYRLRADARRTRSYRSLPASTWPNRLDYLKCSKDVYATITSNPTINHIHDPEGMPLYDKGTISKFRESGEEVFDDDTFVVGDIEGPAPAYPGLPTVAHNDIWYHSKGWGYVDFVAVAKWDGPSGFRLLA